MVVTRWNPLHEMNRFFDDVFDQLPMKFGFDLAIDLYQEGDSLIAEMSAPGIEIKSTKIDVHEDVLRISGSREEKKESKDKNFYSREIHRGSFERAVRLPAAVLEEGTKASYKDGVLRVVMPLKAKSERKKIDIAIE